MTPEPSARHYPIVPYNPIQAAVAFAHREVERRITAGEHLPDNAYAKAFFKGLTGSSKITAREIQHIIPEYVPRKWASKEKILSALDTCIMTSGNLSPLPLPLDVAGKLFPCINARREQRWQHRAELSSWRRGRLYQKRRDFQEQERKAKLDKAWADLDPRTSPQLREWYNDWVCETDRLTDDEARGLLHSWFNGHIISEWQFGDLYHGMSAAMIVYDLGNPQ